MCECIIPLLRYAAACPPSSLVGRVFGSPPPPPPPPPVATDCDWAAETASDPSPSAASAASAVG